MLKANLNFFGCLIVAILFGHECQYFIVFVGVDGIECFAIEMSSATQNRLKIFARANDRLWLCEIL